ncbi:Actin- protein 2/3 complex subunit 2 [Cichlidogyrus casuarinus]|uniref:Arp2/3 complex 34 kDa subunit n=1 Tax=Cichlidogyrus casuarinus TaxID=1844966 RepID=A0ABD2QCI6_9PLAT
MIFLEVHNSAIEEILLTRFENAKLNGKYEKTDFVLADFDGVLFKVFSHAQDKSKLFLTLSIDCFQELANEGATKVLEREYGEYLMSKPIEESSVALQFDLDKLPDDFAKLAHDAALIKRNCFAGVFEKFFEFLGEETVGMKQAVIHFRQDETLYVQAQGDRVIVIFSTVFKDPEDVIIGKVFMQEFTEVRRRFDRAPQVFYSYKNPPPELAGTDAVTGENFAYITLVLFPRHVDEAHLNRSINLIHSLRNFLHYHIKCSKGYIHQRLRAKTTEFIKVLNRAKPDWNSQPAVLVNPLGALSSAVFQSQNTMNSIIDRTESMNLNGDYNEI